VQVTKRVKDPRKQRKRLYNAPAHLRHKLMTAPLSPELTKSKGIKALPVRKGDTVRVVRGDHLGFEGKVNRVDLKRYRVFIEGLTREKVDGTNIFISVHPSKVMIKNLKLDDKWRKVVVERKKKLAPPKRKNKVAKKPAKKVAEVEKEEAVENKAPKAAAKKTAKKKPAAAKKKEARPAEKDKAAKTAKRPKAKPKAVPKNKGGK
jgi:large subunit ribosomal protein L24